jgi:hypothetical protein
MNTPGKISRAKRNRCSKMIVLVTRERIVAGKFLTGNNHTRTGIKWQFFLHSKDRFLQSSGCADLSEKTLANQTIKLEPAGKRFNVRFYYNDGIFYYWTFSEKINRYYP